MTSQPKNFFSSLPVEIIWIILEYLPLHEALVLSQCSQWFNRLSHEPHFWLPRLHDTCRTMGRPAYIFHPADLTPTCLSYIVTNHLRFRSRAKRWAMAHGPGKPTAALPGRHKISISSVPELTPDEKIVCVRLLPGGRFLVTVTVHMLHLWDLGVSEPQARCIIAHRRELSPLERANTPTLDNEVLIQQVRVCDGKFVFNMIIGDLKRFVHSCLLYSIDPNTPNPRFECIGNFSCSRKADFIGFSGSKLLFIAWDDHHQYLGVHYCQDDVTFQWSTGAERYSEIEILEEAELVVGTTKDLDEADFFTLPAPSHHPSYRRGTTHTITNTSLYFLSWKSRLTELSSNILSITPSAFQSNSFPLFPLPPGQEARMDKIVRAEGGKVFLVEQVIRLTHSNTAEPPKFWSPKVIKSTEFPESDFQEGRWDFPFFVIFPDGWRFMWWEDSEALSSRFHFSNTREPIPSKTSFAGNFGKTNSLTSLNFSTSTFDPVLARMCSIDFEGRGFKVVEYAGHGSNEECRAVDETRPEMPTCEEEMKL
ncbi:hypothetical protein DL96DRAFT_19900 [Flagelloscypha sp. PMI_526]|nr:hypothetical protein DL96DRAFT_19900 [Flagelloscypha sp. PMI_526]